MKNIELLYEQYRYGQRLITRDAFLTAYRKLSDGKRQLYEIDFLDTLLPLLQDAPGKQALREFRDALSDEFPKRCCDAMCRPARAYDFFDALPLPRWDEALEALLPLFQAVYHPAYLRSDRAEWQFWDYREPRNHTALQLNPVFYAMKDLEFCCEKFAERAQVSNNRWPNMRIVSVPSISPRWFFHLVTQPYEVFDTLDVMSVLISYCPFCGRELSSFYAGNVRYLHEIEGVTFPSWKRS